MTLIDDYLQYQQEYESKYGSKTIVLMEVGAFYEWYGVDNSKEKIGRVAEICDLLNVQLTRRNKSIIENSRKNPLMGGVNTIAFGKFKPVLLQNGYTVVMVNQFQIDSPKKAKVFDRYVTQIYSPGTDVEECNTIDSIFIMSVFIEVIDKLHTVSISVVDLTTGQSFLFFVHDTNNDECLALDQTFKIIHSFDPKEIVLITEGSEDDFIRTLELDKFIVHSQNLSKKLWKLDYQNEVLQDVFPSTGLLTPIEFLELEQYPNVALSYVLIILFVKDHNKEILKRIKKPVLKHTSVELALLGDTLYQLDLLPTLYKILNKTSTAMGSREFKNRLLNPITSVEELQKRYDRVEWMRNDGYEKYELILSKIRDIERLHRKLELQTLNPCEFATLDSSYEYVEQLLLFFQDDKESLESEIPDMNTILQGNMIGQFQKYRDAYSKYFNVDEMSKSSLVNIVSSFIQKGLFPELDELQLLLNKYMSSLDEMASSLSQLIEIDGSVRVEFVERDCCYYFTTTTKRSKLLQEKVGETNYKFKTTSGTTKISSNETEAISHKVRSLKEKLKTEVREIYLKVLDELYQNYDDLLYSITQFVIEIDILKSSAKVSLLNGYCKPMIIQSKSSFLDCKQLRHPIVEKLQDQLPFVPNDVCLGKGLNGMILYSINAAGKSTLLRSIGLSIIMAQSGNYVAANSFEFCPYYNLISKIANRDDMIRGQSTFMVEMRNLRTMLVRGNNRTLILGDELCSGTEHSSAIAIVASTIIELVKKKTNFMLTSHLHELAHLPEIQELETVKCYHLKVSVHDQEIVFDRILEEGSGPDTYGIEIAEALNLGQEFILRARQFRVQFKEGKSVEKRSRYNSKVKVEKCNICESKSSLHTHHIQFQSLADSKGMIGPFHKNIRHNLVVVCEDCHQNIHRGNIVVKGYKQTTKGIKLKSEVPERNQSETILKSKIPHTQRLLDYKSINKSV